MTGPFIARTPFAGAGPFIARGPFAGIGSPFGSLDGFWAGGVQLYFSQAQHDASTQPGKTLASTAVLVALGITNAQATTNPPLMVTGSDGTVQYAAHNLVGYSNSIGNVGYWGVDNQQTVTTNAAQDPDGVLKATQSILTANGVDRSIGNVNKTLVIGQVYTWSCWAYRPSGSGSQLRLEAAVGASSTTTYTPTGVWTRYSISFTPTGTSVDIRVRHVGNTGDTLYVSKVQLSMGSTVLDYVDTGLTSAAVYAPPITYDRGATHNLVINSEAFSTQTVTVVSGQTYTVSATGTGTITLSGAATGVLTCSSMRPQLTFTTTTTSLTLTASGTVTQVNVNPGYAANYLRTFATAPLYSAGTPKSQNLLLNTATLSTQSVTLTAGCVYTLLHQGTGSVTLSGGGSGTTTAGTALRFVTTAASVTFTVTGSVTLAQLYEGTEDLSYTATTGTAYSAYYQQGLSLDGVGSINKSIYTEDMTNATGWTTAGGGETVTRPGTVIAPDGSTNGNVVTFVASATSRVGNSPVGLAASTTYTWSGYVKSTNGSTDKVRLGYWDGTSVTLGSEITIYPYWTRISGTVVSGAGSVLQPVLCNALDAAVRTVHAWGWQTEVGTVMTPYIPATAGSAVTRDATLIRPPSTWVTDGPQTVGASFTPLNAASGAAIIARGSLGQALSLSSGSGASTIYDGATAVTTGVPTASIPNTVASRWSGVAMGVTLNGAALNTGVFDTTMGSGTVGIGDNGAGALGFRGGIHALKIKYAAANDADMLKISNGLL